MDTALGALVNSTALLAPDGEFDSSLAVDPDGYVHISYYDAVNQCLKYATNRLK